MMTPGAFITFEGGEGCGKSTQIRMLAARLEAAGLSVRAIREPGGTEIGERVRAILLDPASAALDARSELLLYEASRAQLVSEVIEPALAAGEIVICDRFYDSTTAYQGYGRGLPLDQISALNTAATGGLVPDRTIVLDIEPTEGVRRATRIAADRLETEHPDFHVRVRAGFLAIAESEPERVRVVEASGCRDTVAARIAEQLAGVSALTEALR